jgi:protein-disulfide isomerase
VRLHIAAICFGLAAAALFAQAPAASTNAWQTSETLGSIDLSGLSAAQKNAVLKLVREQDCSCLCGMKVAECLVKDPNCSYSKHLAAIAVQGVKDGKSLVEISKLMDSSPKAHRPKLLEDPVSIPVDGSPIKGPADARITIIEFSDFECPYCSLAVKEVYTMMAAYPKDMKLIFKQFPLSMHPNAPLAAAASLAAKEQGKFWELHDLMFANFRRINRDNIMIWAKQVGLDMERFKNDLASTKYQAIIQKDTADGEAVGVYGTPAFFINGKHYNGAVNMEALKPILDAELRGGAKTAAHSN